jgi:hypothetical protein
MYKENDLDMPDNAELPMIVKDTRMCCPKCEQWHNVLSFRPLRTIEKYAHAVNQIVKCPNCGWLFSPASVTLEALHEAFGDVLRAYGHEDEEPGNDTNLRSVA